MTAIYYSLIQFNLETIREMLVSDNSFDNSFCDFPDNAYEE